MLPPVFMQVANSSSANFCAVGAASLLRVGRLEDVVHQLHAARGRRHVVDAHHDGVGLVALHFLARERVRDDGHVGGDAAFERAFARGAAPARRRRASSAANSFFMSSPKRRPVPGRPAVTLLLLRVFAACLRPAALAAALGLFGAPRP